MYAGNICGYVRSIVHDDHEAEDVTQQVFTKLITHVDRYDDRGAPFFSWLIRIARNAAIDHMRRNRLVPMETVIEPGRDCGGTWDRLEAVRDALQVLPEDQRAVVFLRHVVGLTPGEIADRMGRSESSIHGLHHRGRRALQLELSDHASSSGTRGQPITRRQAHLIPA